MINRDMNRYEHGKIYKIVDNGYNKCYVGSTCESLSQRMARHRKDYSRYLKETYPTVITVFLIFDEFGIENCKIDLIETYPCRTKEELLQREGHYIQTLECVNKTVVGRSKEEKKEIRKSKRREEYLTNKDNVKEKAKEYYQNNREYILERRQENWNVQYVSLCFLETIYPYTSNLKIIQHKNDFDELINSSKAFLRECNSGTKSKAT